MNDRKMRFSIAICLTALIAFAVLSVVWLIGLNYCPDPPCTSPQYLKMPELPSNAIETLDKQNLQVQKSIAESSAFIARMTVWSVLLGILGTSVLFWTLFESAKARELAQETSLQALESNRIAREEQRPWLVLDREVGCGFELEGQIVNLDWKYKIRNLGNNPAFSVKTQQKIVSFESYNDLLGFYDEFVTKLNSDARRRPTWKVVFPSKNPKSTYGETGARIEEIKSHFALIFGISYRLSQGEDAEFGSQIVVFEIGPKGTRHADIEEDHILLENPLLNQTT